MDSNVVHEIEELFGVDKHALYRHALFLLGNSADAEDAVSETFIKALRFVGAFKRRASLRTWLWAILRNQCVDMLRNRERIFSKVIPGDTYSDAFDSTVVERLYWTTR
ncbi:sigma factor [Alicyclobacillus sp. ALC3]|uniref:sigma factor n=1 Tax=Alicyclobacillus sp. ALC3 TaxID=2796143 RepID=UPI00237806D8|nr:sigma factor [Alicyclobacillus sp. ALC3]WDL95928.1 hypothetical protein JC200_16435 [Alicyclobacillus sp. ALC3]